MITAVAVESRGQTTEDREEARMMSGGCGSRSEPLPVDAELAMVGCRQPSHPSQQNTEVRRTEDRVQTMEERGPEAEVKPRGLRLHAGRGRKRPSKPWLAVVNHSHSRRPQPPDKPQPLDHSQPAAAKQRRKAGAQ